MTERLKKKTPIFTDIKKNDEWFTEHAGMNKSFDVGVRKLLVLDHAVHLYYLNGLTEDVAVIQIIKELVALNDTGHEKKQSKIKDIIENRFIHQQIKPYDYLEDIMSPLLSGLIVFLIDGQEVGYEIDVRSYPGRNPEEPETEKLVRGARDGYVENLVINTALTRRRIRDGRLRFEIMKIGERSQTDVAIGYIKDVADPGLVDVIKKELKAIKVDGLTMGDKTIEEFIINQGYNPFPLVRYTERPDVAAEHLLEGHVIIITDTSPSVIITPTTIFHHVQHAEEYRQVPAIGTYIRWVRYIGILASLFLLPLWYLFVVEPTLLQGKLEFIGPNKTTNIPIMAQIILAELGIDFLRLAAIHTPTPLSTAMGLVAAALIGQIAIDVGLFTPEVILYVAIVAIGNFATPSYELSLTTKAVRLLMLIVVGIFRVPGFVIGTTLFILFLVGTRSLNTPYLWPFIPFNPRALWRILIRSPKPGEKIRPSIVHPQDDSRQPI